MRYTTTNVHSDRTPRAGESTAQWVARLQGSHAGRHALTKLATKAIHRTEYGGHGAAAHPFMRPAFEAKKDEAAKVFGEVLMQQIEVALR